mgnify:CR=1 FL=1
MDVGLYLKNTIRNGNFLEDDIIIDKKMLEAYFKEELFSGQKLNILKEGLEYLNDLFIEQQGKCKLSGIEISLPKKWNDKNYTASLDRIDSDKGYEKGNVQWVHKHINVMKNIFPQELFL